ncbi:MAG: 16S rRNA (adenine(1518)-N(6)/adenine(1519)-N(6))-dimethyltransferase RsmA [candidate division WOR-3 bacterium]
MSKPRYSQVFLKDSNILRKIVERAQIVEDEWVLEIGPGRGYLTNELLNAGARVIAIEVDKDLFTLLNREFLLFVNDRLFLYNEDFLKANLFEIFNRIGVEKAKVVSNIPYHITTPILEKLVYSRALFPEIYLTVQKEVAERIVAKTGTKEYGSLSIFLNLYFDCKIEFKISRYSFSPVPRVDSAFISLRSKNTPDLKDFESFVRRLFTGRRKKIRTLLRGMGKYHTFIEEKFSHYLDRRPEELEISQLYEIFTEVNTVKDTIE